MRKFIKITGAVVLVLFIALVALAHYISAQFDLTDEEALETFSSMANPPVIKDMEIEDQPVHYAIQKNGNRRLIAFIHGSPGAWSAFVDYFKADSLADQFDMLSMDRPGYGGSGNKALVSIEKEASLLHSFLQTFDYEEIILVGHSLGGPIVARMGMDYVSDYSKLVLLAPSIDPDMEKFEWHRPLIATWLGKWVIPRSFYSSNQELRPLRAELEMMRPLWKKIRRPVIVVQGMKDRLVPKENADFALDMLPDSIVDVRVLEEADHFIPWTHPEECMRAILAGTDSQ